MARDYFPNRSVTYEDAPSVKKAPISNADGIIDIAWLQPVTSGGAITASVEQNRLNYAGSGFVHYGKHYTGNSTEHTVLAEGLWQLHATSSYQSARVNTMMMGPWSSDRGGESTSIAPILNVDGYIIKIGGDIDLTSPSELHEDSAVLRFPGPPTDSSLLTRQDLCFIEVWHEAIDDKDMVYPYGNVQRRITTYKGLTLKNNLTSAGYSQYGAWDTTNPAGYGSQWSLLTPEQKNLYSRDPVNNIYNDDGTLVQVRYRIKTVPGLGNVWDGTKPTQNTQFRYDSTNFVPHQGSGGTVYTTDFTPDAKFVAHPTDKGLFQITSSVFSYTGNVYAIPVMLVQRRNTGAYDPTWNPYGCGKFTDGFWYETALNTSTESCFSNVSGGTSASNVTGRPDGIFFADRINWRDCKDIRNNSNPLPKPDKVLKEKQRLAVSGTMKGFEGEWRMSPKLTASFGDYIDVGTDQARLRINAVSFEGSLYNLQSNTANWISTAFYDVQNQTFSARYTETKVIVLVDGVPHCPYWDNNHDFCKLTNLETNEQNQLLVPPTTVEVIFNYQTDHKFGQMVQCDIFGNPANYPVDWLTEGRSGSIVLADEEGESIYNSTKVTPLPMNLKLSKVPKRGRVKKVLVDGVEKPVGSVYIDHLHNTIDFHTFYPTTYSHFDYWGRGISVNGDGSKIVAGSMRDDVYGSDRGSAFTFIERPDGFYEEVNRFYHNEAKDTYFAYCDGAMSDDGMVLILPHNHKDEPGIGNTGVQYVFDWDVATETWIQRNKIVSPRALVGDYAGHGLALSGDGTVAVVGIGRRDDPSANSGTAEVWKWDGATWVLRDEIYNPVPQNAVFGDSCGCNFDGSKIIIGAYAAEILGGVDQGAVFTFEWNPTTQVYDEISSARLTQPIGRSNSDLFGLGADLTSDGLKLVVSAPRDDAFGTEEGCVFTFEWDGVTQSWTNVGDRLTRPLYHRYGYFGERSVRVSGDGSKLFVGSLQDTLKESSYNEGAVHMFEWDATTSNWISVPRHGDITRDSVIEVYYWAQANPLELDQNNEVSAFGDMYASVWTGHRNKDTASDFASPYFIDDMIGKVPTADSQDINMYSLARMQNMDSVTIDPSTDKLSTVFGDEPSHPPLAMFNAAYASRYTKGAKTFNYLSKKNGKYYMNVLFKELDYLNETNYGDDGKFPVVDYLSTTLDIHGQPVLVGQKSVELEYFVQEDD